MVEAKKIDQNDTVPRRIIVPEVSKTIAEAKGTPALSANMAAAIPNAPYLAMSISVNSMIDSMGSIFSIVNYSASSVSKANMPQIPASGSNKDGKMLSFVVLVAGEGA